MKVNFIVLLICIILINIGALEIRKSSLERSKLIKKLPKLKIVEPQPIIISQAVSDQLKPTIRDIVAKALGYGVGVGAMAMYSPILYKLISNRGHSALSIQTFMFNFVGVSLAMSYPYKKGYPVSTYVELMAMVAQYVAILGLICFRRGLMANFAMGMTGYLLLYWFWLQWKNVPPRILNGVQMIALALCNYANIPQILQSFQTKKTSWSPITSLFSITGCSIRIFTTLTLTKDRLALFGYCFALITNCILLSQIIAYNA